MILEFALRYWGYFAVLVPAAVLVYAHSIRVNEIVLGRRSITPTMSIRFGRFFGQSENFWHGLQMECDFRALAKDRRRLTAAIRPASELVAA